MSPSTLRKAKQPHQRVIGRPKIIVIDSVSLRVTRWPVELLAVRPHRAGELAEALGVTAPAMSKHLRVLRQRGIVTETSPEFDARVRIYSIRSAPMADLRAWLATAEQGWAQQLAAFTEHLSGER